MEQSEAQNAECLTHPYASVPRRSTTSQRFSGLGFSSSPATCSGMTVAPGAPNIRKSSSGAARGLPFAFCQLPHHCFLVSIVKLRNSSPATHMRISSLDRVVRARLLTFCSLGRISSLPVCR
ncbi:hypothetical protein BJV77DRAFT_756282 [Russula vinacea]|nr:hypothetical protein BJV77DRAFT_756282 [Russula vinacea]